MSNPNDLATSFVAMARAFEELPQVKEALEIAMASSEQNAQIIALREERIAALKAELEASHEARRKVEAERDDAEFRFLESEDRVASAMSFLKSTFGSAGSLIQALEPPAPVAIPMPPAEPEVKHEASWADRHGYPPEPMPVDGWATPSTDAPATPSQEGQSDYTPTVPSSTTSGGGDTGNASAPSSEVAPAQADPTPGSVSAWSTDVGNAATSAGASQTEPVSPPTTMPYTDKFYVDHPVYMPLHEWLDGGGTEANYYYRR